MTSSLISLLRKMLPFIVTIVLWRAGTTFWNPAGILAIIPIFYCSFVRPTDWFAPFAIFMCFVIDYSADTRLYWTALYLLVYAISRIQTYIDLTNLDQDSHKAFMLFFGVATGILVFLHPTGMNILRGLWLFAWASTLYVPITEILKRVRE